MYFCRGMLYVFDTGVAVFSSAAVSEFVLLYTPSTTSYLRRWRDCEKFYDSQTYKDSHLFRKGVTSCIFLTLIYTEQEHTRTHTFSKGVGKLSDLKKCGTLYVPYEITWAAGTYKNSHLFKNLWKQSYQIRCESLYVPYLYIWKPGTYKSSHLFKNTDFVLKNIQELTPFHTNLA